MKWFESKAREEVKELKAEVEKLHGEIIDLRGRTEVRVGEWPRYFLGLGDPRPVVQLKDVVLALTDRMKLEIKRTPEVSARIVVERKPKTPNA